MLKIIQSNRFKRDYKRVMKRGLDGGKLSVILNYLSESKILPARCRPHRLSGNYAGFWEFHIEPDWLLIYDLQTNLLELVATGSHADLFE